MNKARPKYLDLLQIRLPVPGLVSILHRISGLALFLFLPFLLWLLQSSLFSPESYERYRAALSHPLIKLVLIGLGLLNLALFEFGVKRSVVDLSPGVAMPASAKTAGLMSLAIWLVVAACGRTIAYF